MMRMSVKPAATASSTTYWIDGLSTTGNISLGWLLVAGRNRVPRPAAGMTAFVTGLVPAGPTFRRYLSAGGALVADVGRLVAAGLEPQLLPAHQSPEIRDVAP